MFQFVEIERKTANVFIEKYMCVYVRAVWEITVYTNLILKLIILYVSFINGNIIVKKYMIKQ